ncbi:MAG: FAD-dependent oxidoreductase [Oceanospirillaceae bacterium]
MTDQPAHNDIQPPAHVTIIGAGIIGMSCAVQLQQQGFKVTVIDRLAPAEAASYGNAGVFAECGCIPVATPGFLYQLPKLLLDPNGPISMPLRYLPKLVSWGTSFALNTRPKQFEHISKSLAALLKDATKLHLQQAELCGAQAYAKASPYYYLYKDRSAFDADKLAWDTRRQYGCEYDLLESSDLYTREQAVGKAFKFAVALHNHGFSPNPAKLVKTMAEYFLAQGGEIHTGEVKTLVKEHGLVTQVITDREIYKVDKLVIAGGAWSSKLVTQLGHKVPLESERGYHVQIKNPGIELNSPIMFTQGKLVATPMQDGIRLAGLVEFNGLKADANEQFCQRLLHHAKSLFPGIDTREHVTWMGHRPSITDSLPVIGQCPTFTNVCYAFGHQHMGLTLGPITGKIITQLLSNVAIKLDLDPYRIDRF